MRRILGAVVWRERGLARNWMPTLLCSNDSGGGEPGEHRTAPLETDQPSIAQTQATIKRKGVTMIIERGARPDALPKPKRGKTALIAVVGVGVGLLFGVGLGVWVLALAILNANR